MSDVRYGTVHTDDGLSLAVVDAQDDGSFAVLGLLERLSLEDVVKQAHEGHGVVVVQVPCDGCDSDEDLAGWHAALDRVTPSAAELAKWLGSSSKFNQRVVAGTQTELLGSLEQLLDTGKVDPSPGREDLRKALGAIHESLKARDSESPLIAARAYALGVACH